MKKIINTVLVIYTLFFSYYNVLSQEVSVKIYPDTSVILIGDQIKVNVQATLPDKYHIKLPFINDSIDKKIEIISQSKVDTNVQKEKSLITITQSYTITSFDTGTYTIPALPFLYTIDKGKTYDTVYSSPFDITVNTVNVDTTLAIKDIKAPLDAPFSLDELMPYFISVLAVIILVFLSIYLYRKYLKAKKENTSMFKPKIPPHVKALEALENLRQKKLWQQDKTKAYYSELSDILRTYFEEEMNFNAMEMTSEEIIEIVSKKTHYDIISKLKQILTTSDLVKFAKHRPLPDENELLFNYVVDIVKLTSVKNNNDNTNEQFQQTNI
jgi:hypothetical protein